VVKQQLQLSVSKCAVLNLGSDKNRSVPSLPYQVNSVALSTVNEYTDLGITYDKHLSFRDYFNKIVSKASQRSRLLLLCFTTRDPCVLMRAFNTYVRPILEYGTIIWSPCFKQDIRKLESVQKRFTKRLNGFNNIDYASRLSRLGACSLELRRIRYDLIACYKILNNLLSSNKPEMLQVSVDTRTRGHPLKIRKAFCRTGRLSHIFENRIVTIWNSLPDYIVLSSSLASFKHAVSNYDLSKFCVCF
jgi:hypothetical protein